MLTQGLSTPAKESEQSRARASRIVIDAVGEYNQRVESGMQVSVEPTSALYGDGGGLDSLGLLDLIIFLETKLEQELGRPVAIVEESAATDAAPFRTVESLIVAVSAILHSRRP